MLLVVVLAMCSFHRLLNDRKPVSSVSRWPEKFAHRVKFRLPAKISPATITNMVFGVANQKSNDTRPDFISLLQSESEQTRDSRSQIFLIEVCETNFV